MTGAQIYGTLAPIARHRAGRHELEGSAMATSDATVRGSSAVQGELWGARARDWAQVQEEAQRELYGPVLDAAGVGAGTRLLDVGCGSGLACIIGAERGARVWGLDAALPLIEIARERLPAADLRVGEIEALPFEDAGFDVVTGFNSFQYAADPERSLREARRVTRPGGAVAIVTWGAPERCDATAYLKALGSLLPPPPSGAPGPFALSEPGALEDLATRAGLTPQTAGELTTRWEYRDSDTVLRGL